MKRIISDRVSIIYGNENTYILVDNKITITKNPYEILYYPIDKFISSINMRQLKNINMDDLSGYISTLLHKKQDLNKIFNISTNENTLKPLFRKLKIKELINKIHPLVNNI